MELSLRVGRLHGLRISLDVVPMSQIASDLNQRIWATGDIASAYQKDVNELLPVEHTIIKGLANEISRARLLDLGVGTGRTTAHLRQICREYIGVDYSAEMINNARLRFPNTDLRLMDARDLSAFETESFDLAVFSFNGLDYVSHEDRLKILKEIYRVLRRDGTFVFSTHNRDATVLPAHSLSNLPLSANPVRLLRNIARYALGLRNSHRLRQFERRETKYALLNDMAHHYRLLTYYVALDAQIAQLEATGFDSVRAFALDGTCLDVNASNRAPGASDYMIHYIARRT